MGTAHASPSSLSSLPPSSFFEPRCLQKGGLCVAWEHLQRKDSGLWYRKKLSRKCVSRSRQLKPCDGPTDNCSFQNAGENPCSRLVNGASDTHLTELCFPPITASITAFFKLWRLHYVRIVHICAHSNAPFAQPRKHSSLCTNTRRHE